MNHMKHYAASGAVARIDLHEFVRSGPPGSVRLRPWRVTVDGQPLPSGMHLEGAVLCINVEVMPPGQYQVSVVLECIDLGKLPIETLSLDAAKLFGRYAEHIQVLEGDFRLDIEASDPPPALPT